jgi:hypothetical protein
MQKRILQIQRRIEKIKQKLLKIGEMRPGSLTRQYQKPKEKKGGFYQISYTYKMKSKTEYVRPEFVKDLKRQVANFRKFKKLVQEWIDLAIEYSHLKLKIAKENR